jgi:hypothetical protein
MFSPNASAYSHAVSSEHEVALRLPMRPADSMVESHCRQCGTVWAGKDKPNHRWRNRVCTFGPNLQIRLFSTAAYRRAEQDLERKFIALLMVISSAFITAANTISSTGCCTKLRL